MPKRELGGLTHIDHGDTAMRQSIGQLAGGQAGDALLLLDGAKAGRVLGLADGRMLAADGAVGSACDPELVEAEVQRVVGEQPAEQRLTDPEQQLYGLGRLKRP